MTARRARIYIAINVKGEEDLIIRNTRDSTFRRDSKRNWNFVKAPKVSNCMRMPLRLRPRLFVSLFERIFAVFVVSLTTSTGLFAQNAPRTIHVFVALADNQHQGIVPVPAGVGNGDDAVHNLFWGAGYGVKTFFARSSDWELLPPTSRPKPEVLERCVFRHRAQNVYLMADAYQGSKIGQAVIDFLQSAAGMNSEQIATKVGARQVSFSVGGGSNLVAYIGHDGLMDFDLSNYPQGTGTNRRDAIIIACFSKRFFGPPLRATGAHPLVWSTGLMAAEAYTLKSALDGWVLGEDDEKIRNRAAAAYHQYQKCSLDAARRLLVTGW